MAFPEKSPKLMSSLLVWIVFVVSAVSGANVFSALGYRNGYVLNCGSLFAEDKPIIVEHFP